MAEQLTATNIEEMVRIFIKKGCEDEILSEIFTKSIKDEEVHVQKVSRFWKHKLLGEGEYQNEVFNHAHEGLEVDGVKKDNQESYILKNGIEVKSPIRKEHFESWIKCFRESAEMVFKNQETVELIVNHAKETAKEMHDIKKHGK